MLTYDEVLLWYCTACGVVTARTRKPVIGRPTLSFECLLCKKATPQSPISFDPERKKLVAPRA